MNLKEYVFVLGSYKCNKNCPYCIAKMNKEETNNFDEELKQLEYNIEKYKQKEINFEQFILSGNGETSLYSIKELSKIKNIVESSKIFKDYRIQTSGNLFFEKNKLELFSNWIKEITVMSFNPLEDQKFYNYSKSYLNQESFLQSTRIRVNIVLLKNNINRINELINNYTSLNNVETIALKILDNSNNESEQSKWIDKNAITYDDIDEILEIVKRDNKYIEYSNKRYVFNTKNNKLLTIHYSKKNEYDEINLKGHFNWHNRPIKKGVYGEFSKIEEEVDEAREALEQNNHLMYLIELSDVIGAIEKIAENHGLTLDDLIRFSKKVKESKRCE